MGCNAKLEFGELYEEVWENHWGKFAGGRFWGGVNTFLLFCILLTLNILCRSAGLQ